MVGSLLLTVNDYVNYSRDPETALLFEAAATEMAYQIRDEEANTAVYLDRWFWDEETQKGWPSIPFLGGFKKCLSLSTRIWLIICRSGITRFNLCLEVL